MALIDVSSYSAETEVPYFSRKVVCAKCGSRGNKIVMPRWRVGIISRCPPAVLPAHNTSFLKRANCYLS